MCFDRNMNGNMDVKLLECDYLLVQGCVKLTLGISITNHETRRLHWYSLTILQPSKNSAKIEFVPITKHKLQPYSFCAIRISKTDLSMPQFQKKIQYLSSNNYWTNGNSQPKRKCKVWLLNLIKQSLQQ